VAAPDETAVIPKLPVHDETAVIPKIGPAVSPARSQPAQPVPPPPNDATATLPAIRGPGAPPGYDQRPLTSDDPSRGGPYSNDPFNNDPFNNDATMLSPRVITYDSPGGAPGYRGKHSDLVPLTEGSPIRTTIRTIGEVMITCGLILLLFAGYEIWGKAAIVSSHQADLDQQLAQQWDNPTVGPPTGSPDPQASATTAAPPPPPPGGTLGRLYLPRLAKYWVVVEGVGDADLQYAPGHYPNTAQPGEVGNFSVAGHRSPAIFWDLDRMQVGDAVVVETRNMFFIYRVTSSEIVNPTDVQVVAPVPDQPGVTPTEAYLTITTCDPKWDNYHRLIVHAKLVRSQNRSDGRPAELQ
jgi:LPXTG-site transpeptidase (sortase) family protein